MEDEAPWDFRDGPDTKKKKKRYDDDEDDDDEKADYYEETLYQRLGVETTASTEEIRAAFLRLSRQWHPDKVDARNKEVADRKFKKIAEAHDILSNEIKRAVYDKHGYDVAIGVQERQLTRFTCREDVLKEGLKNFKPPKKPEEENEEDYEMSVKGKATLHEAFVDPFTGALGNKPHMIGFSMDETITKGIGRGKELLAGVVFNKFPQSASGVIYFGYKLQSRDGQSGGETRVSFADDTTNLAVSGYTRLSPTTTGWATFSIDSAHRGGTLRLALQEKLGQNWHVVVVPSFGQDNSVQLKLVREDRSHRHLHSAYTGGVKFNVDYTDPAVSLGEVTLSLSKDLTRWDSIKWDANFARLRLSANYLRRINGKTAIGVEAAVEQQNLFLSLKAEYLDHKLVVPFYLPLSLWPIVRAFAVPTIGAWYLARFVLNPLKDREKRQKIEKVREKTAQIRAEKREEAMADQGLMQYSVERRIAEESAKRGLVIKLGLYGRVNEEIIQKLKEKQQATETGEKTMEKEKSKEKEKDTGSSVDEDAMVDVTIPLQHMVERSELQLPESSKCTLKGFYDPCPREKKQLYIEYSYGGIPRRVFVSDKEKLRLPSDLHIVKE